MITENETNHQHIEFQPWSKYICDNLKKGPCPDWCGSVGWMLSSKPKGHQFNSRSVNMPGLWTRSLDATGMCLLHMDFFSLSFSLPKNKIPFKKESTLTNGAPKARRSQDSPSQNSWHIHNHRCYIKLEKETGIEEWTSHRTAAFTCSIPSAGPLFILRKPYQKAHNHMQDRQKLRKRKT